MGNIPGRCTGSVPEHLRVGLHTPVRLGKVGVSSGKSIAAAGGASSTRPRWRSVGFHAAVGGGLLHVARVETGLPVDKSKDASPW